MALSTKDLDKMFREAETKAKAKENVYQQLAQKQYANQFKNNNLLDALSYGAKTGVNQLTHGVESSALGLGQSLTDLVGATNTSNTLAEKLKQNAAQQEQRQSAINSQYNTNFGWLAKGTSDLTAGVINMLPTVAAALVTPQGKAVAASRLARAGSKALRALPTAGAIGVTASGTGINQALNEGATINEAKKYGLGTAAKEIATELPFAGISRVPGVINLGERVASNKIARGAVNAATEGAEEAASEYLDPFIQRATYKPNAENATADEMLYSALLGAATAGVINTGLSGASKVANKALNSRNGQRILPRPQNDVQNQVQNAQTLQNGLNRVQNESMINLSNVQQNTSQNQIYEPEKIRNQLISEQEAILKEKRQLEKQKKQLERSEQEKLYAEIRNLENNIALLRGNRSTAFDNALYNAMDKYTTPQQKTNAEQNLEMSERTFDNVTDKNVKAYQSTHPEVKKFYREQAEIMLNNLNNMIDGGRVYGFDPETRNVKNMRSQSRLASSQIERLMNAGMTKAQIKDGLERIIRDNGAENTANAKKVEIAVDDSLTNGYQSMQGQVPKNFDFVYNNTDADTMQAVYDRLNTEDSFENSSNPDMLINELEYLDERIGKKRVSESEQKQLADAYSSLLPDMSVYETMTAEELHNEMDKLESASRYAPDNIAQEMMDRYEYLEMLEEGRVNEFTENEELEEQITELEKQLRNKKLTFDPKKQEEIRNIEKKMRELEAKQGSISIFNKQIGNQNNQVVAENTTTVEEQAPILYEDYDLSKLPEDVLEFYNEAGNVAGKAQFDIQIVRGLPNNANGMYVPSTNTILLDGDKMTDIETIGKVISHEGYHALNNTDSHKYIIDLAVENRKLTDPKATLDSMITEKIEDYVNRSQGRVILDRKGAEDEIGAAFIDEIMQNPDVAERVWNQNPTLIEKLMRWLEDAIAKVKNMISGNPQSEIYQKALDAYNQGLMNLQFAQQNTMQGAERYSIGYTTDGKPVVRIEDDIFVNVEPGEKPQKVVSDYIKKHIGEVYTIVESGQKVYIGDDLPGEYTHSNSTQRMKNNNKWNNLNAKNQSIQNVGELIEIATNRRWEKNIKEKHAKDAKYGWYQYETRFALPDGKVYTADLLIRNDSDGRKYLYDEINIKKDSSSHLASTLKGSAMVDGVKPSEERTAFADTSISENQQDVNGNIRYSFDDREYLDAVNRGDMETAQRMVDEAAAKSGYTKKLYHQTGDSFTQFNTDNQGAGKYDHETPTGIFLKPDDRDIGLNGKQQMSLLANMQNPLHFADRNSLSYFWKKNIPGYADIVQQISENDIEYQSMYDEADKRDTEVYIKLRRDWRSGAINQEQFEKAIEYVENEAGQVLKEWENVNNALRLDAKSLIDAYMQSSGYDGVIIDRDAGSFGRSTKSYIVFEPEQVKQNQVVTYDDEGNVIPLSKRFNAENSDIRYSLPEERKEKQFQITQRYNPMNDDYHTGIRSADDILSFEEAIEEGAYTPDYTEEMTNNALRKGEITVYSSYPISQGVFVTPSKMEAQNYAGNGKVYSKTVGIDDVAWIDTIEGQYANLNDEDIRYNLDDLVDEYGAIPKGENPTGDNRNIDIPRQTNDDSRVSTFARTAAESRNVADETNNMLVSEIENGRFNYKASGNKEQINKADRLINQSGWEQKARDFQSKYRSGQMMTADDIVLGERLIQEAQSAGDYTLAVDLIADIATIGTELGKSVQALSVLKRLSPEDKVKSLKRVEERVNSELIAQGKETVKIPEGMAERMLQAESEQMQSEIWDDCIQAMADQSPATLTDKVNAYRYLAMLSNPRTHIRNVVGNATMLGVNNLKRGIQAGLEKRLLTAGEERYAELNKNVPKEYFDFAKYSWETDGKYRAKAGGGRYNDAISQIEQNKRIFKNNGLEKARKANEHLLEDVEDMGFKKKIYIDTMARYMYANKLSPSELQSTASNANYKKGVEHALDEAFKGTFQEASKTASLLAKLENSNPAAKFIMGAVVPFKKTPINILKRGVEYSPVGLLNGLNAMLRGVEKGKYTKAQAIDMISSGLTGTAIMVLGYFMASMGMIEAGGDEDDSRKSWYDQQMGSQNFALVLPNGGTATIDWLAPSVMPLMAGAELYNQMVAENPANENSTAVTNTLESISKVANPVLEMSMLQGLTGALQSYNSGTTGVLSDMLSSMATSYGGQFIPAPVGALARTVDPTVRSSYAPKDSLITKTGEKFLRQQVNKIPFASMTNEASIDLWGNERKREGGNIVGRAINNFINPATYSSNKKTDVDYKLDELYKKTGDSGVYPKSAAYTINETKKTPKVIMNGREYAQYAKIQGQYSYSYVQEFMNMPEYDRLSDEAKADVISKLYSLAVYQAKKEIMLGRGYDYENSTYDKALKAKSPIRYYIIKQKK